MGSRFHRAMACVLWLLVAVAVLAQDRPAQDRPAQDRPARDASTRDGNPVARPTLPVTADLLQVPLPITGLADDRVKEAISRVLDAERGEQTRPIVVLEFSSANSVGRGSDFERCLSLARYLTSPQLRSVRTIAYIPGDLFGHAILPALACEELILARDTQFGEASEEGEDVDEVMLGGYRETVERRRTLPVAIALGMVDPNRTVLRVETLDGVRYPFAEDLEALRATTTISSVETVVRSGDLARFSGRELRLQYGMVGRWAASRNELSALLGIAPEALEQRPLEAGEWSPLLVELDGPIGSDMINAAIRGIRQQLSAEPFNFLCIELDSPGGSVADSLRLANFLAGLDPAQVRTVAFITGEARGDAALIAFACDEVVMPRDGLLGGPGAEVIRPRDRDPVRRAVRALAEEKGRDWSLIAGLIDPDFEVSTYTRADQNGERFFSLEEVKQQADAAQWVRGEPLNLEDGLQGERAKRYRLAEHFAEELTELAAIYGLPAEITAVRPNWAHRFIEYLATPQVAAFLLFVACFAGFAELSSPGLGVPGFVAGVCFVIYFWSQFLHGTAGWLEVLLFCFGLVAVALELLVLPGVGLFGIGGGVLIIGSIVLASQTFVIPQNDYQLAQLPRSLATVVAAILGAVAALMAMSRYLPETPLVRRLLLDADEVENREEREALVEYRHLMGKRGVTTSPLTPSGKAQFGDQVVGVITEGIAVDAGADIVVSEVHGSRVVVRPL